MEQWVLWSVALYIALFFIIKWVSRYLGDYYHNKAVHLVIITKNSQHALEWMIRSYYVWNGTQGKPGQITCIDAGSNDDTLFILKRLKQRYPRLDVICFSEEPDVDEAIYRWLQTRQKNNDKLIVMDLREPDSSEIKESEEGLA
ncbi:hypothetical protein [Thermoactinomyces mirandus]|uniref:Uncharacterized protein n=1 Tax=Thermoactinomyces mirandus TaxID=2756294 RepID=A0A7W1XUL6_9BACL|nr:hypothetical protein [Thermoactinomyces mirandus]MBA4603481.1 hypothetical protein [Thermoactinomyces mirandus]